MIVKALQVGRPRLVPMGSRQVSTAIGKTAVTDAVRASTQGLTGDEQADQKAHGGPDRAVSAYPFAHYQAWREEFPETRFPLGIFGENLTLDGATEATACIGDIVRLGAATLQVTQPRIPCYKINLATGLDGILLRVQATGRIGWLYRVLEPGEIAAGTPMALLERPNPDWSIERAFGVYEGLRAKDSTMIASVAGLLACQGLAAQMQRGIEAMAARAAATP